MMAGGVAVSGVTGSALGQATTEPVPSAPAFQPERARDAQGYVTGPGRNGWWNDGVFYQVFVRSFQDSDAGPLANDGIGDIRGLISRLDYLNDGDPKTDTDLGITGIWLMPMNPSPSYHGYDIDDYYGVNRQYGTLEDFQLLMRECHKRGIRVIIDLVINHSSANNPWFKEAQDPRSPKRDWYIWSEQNPGYRGPWNQQVWHPQHAPARGDRSRRPEGQDAGAARGPYFYGLFSREMPDLNFRNEAVTEEIFKVIRFWLDKSPTGPGVDGFRLDAIRHLIEDGKQQDNTIETHKWLERFFATYKRANPDSVAVGEVWASTEIASSYVGNQMDLAFEFDLAGAMVESARRGVAGPVARAQDKVLKFYPPNQYGRFLTNHDQTRVASELNGDPGKLRTVATMLLTGPGVPFVYYAEELGQPGKKPDPELRTPMPWTDGATAFSKGKPWKAPYTSPAGTSVEAQTRDEGSLLSYYRRLIGLRQAHRSLSIGGYVALEASNPAVFAFLRHAPAEAGRDASTALVVINLSDKAVEQTVLKGPTSSLRGSQVATDVLAKAETVKVTIAADGEGVLGPITIPKLRPYQSMILPLGD